MLRCMPPCCIHFKTCLYSSMLPLFIIEISLSLWAKPLGHSSFLIHVLLEPVCCTQPAYGERERETVYNKREVLNPGKACCLALEWNKVRHFWHIEETPPHSQSLTNKTAEVGKRCSEALNICGRFLILLTNFIPQIFL